MPEGQFSMRYETASINKGMREYQQQIGQVVQWYVYDRANTELDPIYDEGDFGLTVGRAWKQPIPIPIISTQRRQGGEPSSQDRGLYTTDTLHLVLSYEQVKQAGLPSLATRAEAHLLDRFLFQGIVCSPTSIWSRGILESRYHVIGVDAIEVDPAELSNDPQFRSFAL